MNALKLTSLAGLCVVLTGCPQIFDALVNNENPHSLSASRGEGSAVRISWQAPSFKEGDSTTVSHYNVHKDGAEIGQTSSTSWSDVPNPAEQHSYFVTADLSTGQESGSSNSDTGWYVPAKLLKLGKSPGLFSKSNTDWYKTMVVRGWTYHFVATTGTPTISLRDWDSPWNEITFTGTGTLVWTADRTKEIWVEVFNSSDLEAWYD